ncbi:hypothetical protein RM844_04335 [Streptomyces sp. DSM 44915]|uniref:Secreted protein n=1 Tax=Streptomyces chisholmiae TaxID=3075540 RepID=A0ABU2JKK2_9ACTN|nr:hypothetical protein [Streptomyces sp. DSM 44915]MDT0265518.1 hypothetical protein [Streptomyces sp. DSM 44915]
MDQPRSDQRPGGLRRRFGALLPFVLIVGLVAGAWGAHRWWVGQPYPTEDPTETMRRLHEYARTAYDVLGIDDEITPRADRTDCAPPGFRGQQSASAATDAFGVAYRWHTPVEPGDGRPALEELRAGLAVSGWRVTEEEYENPERLRLRMAQGEDELVARYHALSRYGEGPVLEVGFFAPCRQLPPGHDGHQRLRPDQPPLSGARVPG